MWQFENLKMGNPFIIPATSIITGYFQIFKLTNFQIDLYFQIFKLTNFQILIYG